MTIEELLDIATDHVAAAAKEHEALLSMRYSLTAQAAAMTAQAMILAQAMPPTSEGGMRVLQVDEGKP